MARALTVDPLTPVRAALEEVSGAAIVLDPHLTVQLATPGAEALLGFPIPFGTSLPKVLCGDSPVRPVAEALAAGRPVQAMLRRPVRGAEERVVRVRSVPLGAEKARLGWLIFLEEVREASADGALTFQGITTRDPAMKQMFHIVERVAEADSAVLVRGETGAGKDLVANAVHALSPRRHGPFRAINCAAVPASLMESELFGHVRGAFTGAVKDAPGHFQSADGGTLFLDEVAELPLELQAKLLRVLETRTVLPVGGRQPIPVDVRIVSATHRSLRKAVETGVFRADLMFRLRVIPIFLPPLRARRGDVLLLAEQFLAELGAKSRRKVERIAPATARILEDYDWPGNVRELRNVLEYALVIGTGPILAPSDLPPELVNPSLAADAPERPAETPPPHTPEGAERERITRALERSAQSRERAAQILGISRATLWRRMKALGLLP